MASRATNPWDSHTYATLGSLSREETNNVTSWRVNKHLHDSLVLPKVLVALEQKPVHGQVAAVDVQLARALLGRDHLQ